MALPLLDATPASATANTYVTADAADAVLAGLSAVTTAPWDAGGAEARTRALIEATALLDLREWAGTATTRDQALQWPRRGVHDVERGQGIAHRDSLGWGGYAYLPDRVIPRWLQRATVRLALALLKVDQATAPSGGSGPDASGALAALAGFKSVKIGPIEIELPTSSTKPALPAASDPDDDPRRTLPPDVVRLCRPYLAGGMGVRVRRG